MAEYIISEVELNSMLDALGSPHIKNGEKIIRCRDCRWFEKLTHQAPDMTDVVDYSCCRSYSFVDPSGFCAWAERA